MSLRRSTLITLLILLAVAAVFLYTSISSGQVECEICITFEGRSQCRTAAAPSEEDARRSAATAACATLAAGRAASMECERTPPRSSSCGP